MLYSNINGFNNDSGLIYKNFNGLAQYKVKNMYPSYSTPQAKYINKENEKELLETMRDNSSDLVNKDGDKRINDIPNVGLQDGGFKNKGNIETQTDEKGINKLIITKEAKALARRNIRKLPTDKTKPTRGSQEIMSKFRTFLNSMEGNKGKFDNTRKGKGKGKENINNSRTRYNTFSDNYNNNNNDNVPDYDMI